MTITRVAFETLPSLTPSRTAYRDFFFIAGLRMPSICWR
jgi:hypothetical protein